MKSENLDLIKMNENTGMILYVYLQNLIFFLICVRAINIFTVVSYLYVI